jgi:glycosyltransferase involved in cell wall biosynthesis
MKLVVVTSFPIHPPTGGGQRRIFGLYSALARQGVEVDVVALVDRDARGGTRELAPGLRETRVPKSHHHDAREFVLQQQAGVPATDLALATEHELTPRFHEALKRASDGAAAVVASHPFSQPAIEAAGVGPLIYEAHNVEADLKAPMLGEGELLDVVRRVERDCCADADHVIVCSAADGARLAELYGLNTEATVVVPNGVDPGAVGFTGPQERAERKRRLHAHDGFQAVFVGSWHEPNVVAARDVLAAARQLPGLRFLIVGSVGEALRNDDIPANVDVCGLVDDRFLQTVLGIGDAALNPMRFGSGTNLKMLDYALSGVPMVASSVGVRGLAMTAGRHYLEAEPESTAEGIEALRSLDGEQLAAQIDAARAHVAEHFAWDAVARSWLEAPALRHLLAGAPA